MSDKKLTIEIEVNAQGAVTSIKNLDGQILKLDQSVASAKTGFGGLKNATGLLQSAFSGLEQLVAAGIISQMAKSAIISL